MVNVLWWDPSLLPTLPLILAKFLDLIVCFLPCEMSPFVRDIGKRDRRKW